jgi:hypothetical protein
MDIGSINLKGSLTTPTSGSTIGTIGNPVEMAYITTVSGDLSVDASSFTRALSGTDSTAQLAFERLDQHRHNLGAIKADLVSNNGDGSVDVASGVIYLCTGLDFEGTLTPFTLPALTGATLTDQSVNYLIADYNDGTPQYVITTNSLLINGSTKVAVANMFREGDELHVIQTDFAKATATRVVNRLLTEKRFVRTSGLILSEAGTRNIAVNLGNVFYGIVATTCPAVNSAADQLTVYTHLSGAWTSTSATQYDNLNYDDGTDVMELSAGNYGVNWVYRFVETHKHIAIILGNESYNITDAKNSQPPAAPLVLQRQSILIGRIIVKKGEGAATQIDSAFASSYETTPVQDHNSVGGLQGGDGADSYYHLSLGNYNSTVSGIPLWDSAHSTVLANSASWEESSDISYMSGVVDGKLATSDFNAYSGSVNLVLTGKLDTGIYQSVSGDWNSVYSTVGSNSSTWDTAASKLDKSEFDNYSGSVNLTLTGLAATDNSLSAVISGHTSQISAMSAASGNWDSSYTSLLNTSGGWDSVYSTVGPNSSTWDTATSKLNTSDFNTYSGEVNSTLTGLVAADNSLSAVISGHTSQISTMGSASGGWNSVYSSVGSSSGSWDSGFSTLQNTSGNWDSVHSSVGSSSGSWDSGFSTLQSGSGDWSSVYSSVGSSSGDWNEVSGKLSTSDFNIFSGDITMLGTVVSGTWNAVPVAWTYVNKTGAVPGDVGAESPLTFNSPIVRTTNTVSLSYNANNLALSASLLNTVQNINTAAVPQFAGLVAPYVRPSADGAGAVQIRKADGVTSMATFDTLSGRMYVGGTSNPAAVLHLPAGTAIAGTAPFKMTSGAVMTSPEQGAVEYDGINMLYTGSIAVRQKLVPAAYGSIYEDNAAGTTISLTASNTYFGWVTSTDGIHLLTTRSDNATADQLVVSSGGDGIYRINATGTCALGNQAVTFHVTVHKNNNPVAACLQEMRVSNTGNWINFNVGGLVAAAATDFFDVRFNKLSGGNTSVVVYHMSFTMDRVAR